MKAILLGAGASKSYSQSSTGVRMPIARDFFQTFDQLTIAANPWVLIQGLIGYLMESRNISIEEVYYYLRSGIDIEVLHTEIEAIRGANLKEKKGIIENYFPYRAYNELIFLFTSVINEIQNGPISLPHTSIAKLLSHEDAVITYNWDTLMDRALADITDWKPDWGYGITPHKIFREGWVNPNQNENKKYPRLLKMHGSTNWITSHKLTDMKGEIIHSHTADPAMLHVYEHASAPYACFAGRYMAGYAPYSYGYYPPNLIDVEGKAAEEGYVIVQTRPKNPLVKEGEAPDNGLTSMPLIIPPVKAKRYDFFGSLFSRIWNEAENVIADAEQIIIIGYSFPQTDIQSAELFKKAFMRRKTMPQIVIIDPSPDSIAARFQLDFGITPDKMTVVKDYFSEKMDLQSVCKLK